MSCANCHGRCIRRARRGSPDSARLMGGAAMNRPRVEAWATLDPGPYPMAAFTFVDQPLVDYAMVRYLWRVFRDLRDRSVL